MNYLIIYSNFVENEYPGSKLESKLPSVLDVPLVTVCSVESALNQVTLEPDPTLN